MKNKLLFRATGIIFMADERAVEVVNVENLIKYQVITLIQKISSIMVSAYFGVVLFRLV